MTDSIDQEDPFKKYGGQQVSDQEDPFKKYGGSAIEEPVKKKFIRTGWGALVGGSENGNSQSQSSGGGLGKIGTAAKVIEESEFDKWKKDKPVITFESTDPIKEAADFQRRQAAKFLYPDQTTGKPSKVTPLQSFDALTTLKRNEDEIYNAFGDDVELAEKYLQRELGKKDVKLAPKTEGTIPGLSEYMASQHPQSLADTPIQNFSTEEIAKGIDPKNKTQVAAFNVVKRMRALDEAINTGTSVDDMAAKYQGEDLKELPQAKAGQRVDEFLNIPQVKQLADTDPDFYMQYKKASDELYEKYPSYAQKKVAQEIAQTLENNKMTGWLYANPSVKKTDKAVEMLLESGKFGPKEVEVYENMIKPYAIAHASDKVLPLTDLIHNAGYGVYKGFSDAASSVRDVLNKTVGGGFLDPQGNSLFQNLGLMENNEDRMKRLEQEEYATPHVTGSTGFRRTVAEGSQFAGFTLPMMGASLLRIPQAATMALMFEGQNADQARKYFPKDMGAQLRYTTMGTGIDMMLGELLPTKQAAAGIKKALMNDAKGIIEDLTNKKISEEAAKIKFGDKLFNYVSNVVKGNVETGTVLTAFDKAHKLLDATFGQRNFNVPDEIISAIQEAKTNFLTPTGLSAMGAIGKMPNSNQIKEKVYLEAANNPERYETGIAAKEKTNPSLAAQMKDNLNFLVQVNGYLEKQNIPQENIGKYLDRALREKVLQEEIKSSPDKFTMRKHDKEVRTIQIEKEKLTEPDMTNTDFIEELYNEEIIPKSDRMFVENNETGKFEPNKVGAYLKYIAQQSNNLDGNWKPHKSEGPKMDNYPPLLIEAANEKWRKEIDKALEEKDKVEIDQVRELADENTPTETIEVKLPEIQVEYETITIPENNTENKQSELKKTQEVKPVEPTPESGTGTEPPKDAPGETKPVPEENSNLIGITHDQMNKVAQELGLGDYEKDPETFKEWDEQVTERLEKDPQAIHKMLKRFEDGKIDDPVDQRMMLRYMASLKDRINKGATPELMAEWKRGRRLSDISGRMLGKSLVARKGAMEVTDSLADFLLDKEESQGFPLRPYQIEQKTKEFNDLKKAKEELETQLETEREQHAKLVAEYGFNKAKAMAKKAAKKTNEDYKKEREEIRKSASVALKKIREGSLKSTVFGFAELKALAPHIKNYLKSLLDQGVDKLDVAVAQIKAEFKDSLDISSADILDIIGGKYDETRPTQNQLAAKMRMLKREAQLLKELERARKGEEMAKTNAKKAPYSQRIEELKQKIEDVRQKNKETELGEAPEESSANLKTDVEKDRAYQTTLLNKIKNLEKDIKEKNYSKEPKPQKPFAKSQKTKALEDVVIAMEKKFAEERYKDNQSKLKGWQKAWDKAQSILNIRRILQTTLDASIWLRQLGSLVLNPRKWGVAKEFIKKGSQSAFSQRSYDRIMNEIHKSPDFKETVEDGIRYNEIDKPNEFYPKSFIYKIPVLKQILGVSQRIADASLNVARYELYQKYKKSLLKYGITRESDPETYKQMAKLVMNSTGSGNMLGMFENPKAEKAMGSIFYGSRLMAANFNTLNPIYYAKMPSAVRKQAMADLASYSITTITTALGLMAAGGNIQLDPDKPDFLQIRFGNKVYDLSGGKAAYIRTFLRWCEAGYARATKSKYEANKALEFASKSTVRFWRNKLAPNTGYATSAIMGKDAIGRDFDWKDIYEDTMPLYADDAWRSAKQDGWLSIPAVILPNILGVGYSSYYSEPAEQDLDDLIERNVRTDEQDLSGLKNYNKGGRDANKDEKARYIIDRDEAITKMLTRLFNKGAVVTENGKTFLKPFEGLSKDQIVEETSDIKGKATRKVKKKLFGENEDDTDEKEQKKEEREMKKDLFPDEYEKDD